MLVIMSAADVSEFIAEPRPRDCNKELRDRARGRAPESEWVQDGTVRNFVEFAWPDSVQWIPEIAANGKAFGNTDDFSTCDRATLQLWYPNHIREGDMLLPLIGAVNTDCGPDEQDDEVLSRCWMNLSECLRLVGNDPNPRTRYRQVHCVYTEWSRCSLLDFNAKWNRSSYPKASSAERVRYWAPGAPKGRSVIDLLAPMLPQSVAPADPEAASAEAAPSAADRRTFRRRAVAASAVASAAAIAAAPAGTAGQAAGAAPSAGRAPRRRASAEVSAAAEVGPVLTERVDPAKRGKKGGAGRGGGRVGRGRGRALGSHRLTAQVGSPDSEDESTAEEQGQAAEDVAGTAAAAAHSVFMQEVAGVRSPSTEEPELSRRRPPSMPLSAPPSTQPGPQNVADMLQMPNLHMLISQLQTTSPSGVPGPPAIATTAPGAATAAAESAPAADQATQISRLTAELAEIKRQHAQSRTECQRLREQVAAAEQQTAEYRFWDFADWVKTLEKAYELLCEHSGRRLDADAVTNVQVICTRLVHEYGRVWQMYGNNLRGMGFVCNRRMLPQSVASGSAAPADTQAAAGQSTGN